jgi:ubiquinone/menaquinone biosynthesis C-methylase UbiE
MSTVTDNALDSYIIRGGVEGRARLAVVARVLFPTTRSLLDRFEPLQGGVLIDAGCGGGDVTFELAARAGATGCAIGLDVDDVKLELARAAAAERGLANVEFRKVDVLDAWPVGGASLVYIRFVLMHLTDPGTMLARAREALRPGGVLVVEDVDYGGEFCDPPCAAFNRYSDLFVQAAQRRGADPFIGRKLTRMLQDAGFSHVDSALVQPYGRSGDVKQLQLLTFLAIRDALVESGMADAAEIAGIARELDAFAARADTTLGCPRIFQVWGCV